jgi:AcrR family transcriptional regulator
MTNHVKGHRGLTAERVVDAALQAADEGGIEAVSLRRLAAALDVTPMAIYRHVRNKSHLLDLMAERLLGEVDLTPPEPATWQDALRRLLASFQAVAAAHPSTALLLSRPFISPAALRVAEAMLALLRSAGFDASQSMRLLQVITGMVLGPAINRATWAAASRGRWTPGASPGPRDVDAQFGDWSAGPAADALTIDLIVGGLEALRARAQGP